MKLKEVEGAMISYNEVTKTKDEKIEK